MHGVAAWPAAAPTRVPFVLVVSAALVGAERLVGLTRLAGGSAPGLVDRNHGTQGLRLYRPLPELRVPAGQMYALVGVDRGDEFRGVPPEQALPVILQRGRTPWISANVPKLGWCWDGNPHTWLGVASATTRIDADSPRIETT